MLILDTDHLSLIQHKDSAEARRLARRLSENVGEEIVATIVSFEEQTRGWLTFIAKARNATQQVAAYRRLRLHLDLYRSIPVIDFDEAAATEFQALSRRRLRIGTMDLRIAAIALSRRARLLTRNLADFEQVPGLTAEDWTA